MTEASDYNEDYFLRGKESGKSLYENYRWLPELTLPMAERIVEHCGIKREHKVLDFGCARGYLVKALTQLAYDARGVDVSEWAIANADPEVRGQCYLIQPRIDPLKEMEWLDRSQFDWVIAKDVLEHCPFVDNTIDQLMTVARVGIFVVVPLSKYNHNPYVIEEYEKDVTHTQRWNLSSWVNRFLRPGWSVEASYRVRGIKDNYKQYPLGNGFITARRIEE